MLNDVFHGFLMDKQYFKYGKEEINYLKSVDSRLGEIIDEIGMIERLVVPDSFQCLARCIISQLISSKAAETIYNRLEEKAGTVSPRRLIQLGRDEIKSCGVSYKKADYILNVAKELEDGSLNFDQLVNLSDQEVIEILKSYPGIGRWTAEMMLIFNFHRMNVLSYDDLVIRNAIIKLYKHRKLSRKQFVKYSKRFSPYGTIASLYLWRWYSLEFG